MNKQLESFFRRHPDTPPLGAKSSVHGYNRYRFKKAREEIEEQAANIEDIICHTNWLLNQIGMPMIESPRLETSQSINYKIIQQDYKLADKRDIIWMKFTSDGYLGVVAVSNDINFDMPQSSTDYDKKHGSRWRHNTSGILVHQVEKKWDTSFVLVFPLSKIPANCCRRDIERAVGNYLIYKKVRIIDYFSHNY